MNTITVNDLTLTVVKETEKAVAIEAWKSGLNGDYKINVWLPKSMINDGVIPEWFLQKKMMENRACLNSIFDFVTK